MLCSELFAMPKNVEVKAKIHDTDTMIKKAVDLCKTEPEIIKQSDTFFNTENGRLKLREFEVPYSLHMLEIKY